MFCHKMGNTYEHFYSMAFMSWGLIQQVGQHSISVNLESSAISNLAIPLCASIWHPSFGLSSETNKNQIQFPIPQKPFAYTTTKKKFKSVPLLIVQAAFFELFNF